MDSQARAEHDALELFKQNSIEEIRMKEANTRYVVQWISYDDKA
jgi:hypothetical protein